MPFGEFAVIQPFVSLERGTEYPFIAMEDVEPKRRAVFPGSERVWDGGGGARFENGDVLFARITPCLEHGKTVQVQSLATGAGFGSTEFFVFRGRECVSDSRYIYYLACSDVLREPAIKSMVGASGRQRAQRSVVEETMVPAPPLAVQCEIADILCTYDDLIENNRRRMVLLEDAARQLYREWFVRLRFPGHEHTRIVNGVPEGWELKPLSELTCHLKRGITPHYDEDAEGLVINQKCVRNGRINLNLARHQSREFKTDLQIQVGDVLVNSTGEGTLGRIAQVKAPIENCTVDTHVTIVRPKPYILIHYFGMAVMAWETQFSTMGRGATNQTELSPTTIGKAEIMLSSKTLMEQFDLLAEPIFQQVTNLVTQNDKLKAARDLLLPRLMNGGLLV